ncbi:hypothetical protein F4825DRAFT_461861 [Nemania diffusa]|nr:hypothetical protein F4825DRAFT_461861 [Nemania diffusa]
MCLTIITHKMGCDIRPVMPHPSNSDVLVVDPYVSSPASCCIIDLTAPTVKPSRGNCAIHPCCEMSMQTFTCGCYSNVSYRRYEPANTPTQYIEATKDIPPSGVWRKLDSLDDVLRPIEDAQQAETTPPSEQLRIARRGRSFTSQQTNPIVKELEATIIRRGRAQRNFQSGGPITEFQAANAALELIADKAGELEKALETWKRMQETLEVREYGKISTIDASR